MWVMVPQVRVSMRDVLCISLDSPKSATLAVMPVGESCMGKHQAQLCGPCRQVEACSQAQPLTLLPHIWQVPLLGLTQRLRSFRRLSARSR